MKHLFESARRRGYQVARVKVTNERGTYDLYFLKDRQGRVLFDGRSFGLDELKWLMPDDATVKI
jgi:hypothetical protein